MALAITQAVSRVVDNRHRTVDILGGAVIGTGAAICGYRPGPPQKGHLASRRRGGGACLPFIFFKGVACVFCLICIVKSIFLYAVKSLTEKNVHPRKGLKEFTELMGFARFAIFRIFLHGLQYFHLFNASFEAF